jgi:hypothetical protein
MVILTFDGDGGTSAARKCGLKKLNTDFAG